MGVHSACTRSNGLNGLTEAMPASWLPGSDNACCVTFRPSQTAGLQIGRGCAFSLHEPRKLSRALLRARLPALALGLRSSATPRVVAGHGWTSGVQPSPVAGTDAVARRAPAGHRSLGIEPHRPHSCSMFLEVRRMTTSPDPSADTAAHGRCAALPCRTTGRAYRSSLSH